MNKLVFSEWDADTIRAEQAGLADLLIESVGAGARILDTRSGDVAEYLYQKLGFQLAGRIPGYAKSTTGSFDETSVMYQTLS